MHREITEIKFGPQGSKLLEFGGKNTEIIIYNYNNKNSTISELTL